MREYWLTFKSDWWFWMYMWFKKPIFYQWFLNADRERLFARGSN